ncbi:MAG: hypothetical protein OXC98_10165 [bacterium]|nr:hypothetical protein [Acidimicrobiia bacterium]MCY4650713.1 hypothetical protein [bacterium]
MAEILGLDILVTQMILAIGLALLAGNAWATFRHLKGQPPPGQRGGFRPKRAAFMMAAGILMVTWSLVSMLS